MKRTAGLCAILVGLTLIPVGLYWASPYLLNPSAAVEGVPPKGDGTTGNTGPRQTYTWAEKLERPGLPNLHKVSADLYRGAQPDPKDTGFAELRKMGIKTVVNLRSLHGESDEVEDAGLQYKRIRFNPLGAPEDEEIIAFLKVVTDPAKAPAFVHCQHGADRTGTMCAAYRVVVQGWPRDEAVREMKDGGYNFHAKYYEGYAQYILNLDIEKIRKVIQSP